jgi:hypothetical protein
MTREGRGKREKGEWGMSETAINLCETTTKYERHVPSTTLPKYRSRNAFSVSAPVTQASEWPRLGFTIPQAHRVRRAVRHCVFDGRRANG